jgi:hypothetical protein
MKHPLIVLATAGLVLAGAVAEAFPSTADVDISVLSSRGQPLPLYPTYDVGPGHTSFRTDRARRAWLEATPGAPYAIRVRNRGAERVGVVIAVDGRNIISGERSRLASTEQMYVLEPYQSAVYEGWRTAHHQVNAFYFTTEPLSYAAAFGDHSAIGVISAAVFRDADASRNHERAPHYYGGGKQAPPAGKQKQGDAATGFGEEIHSPSRRVPFRAVRTPASVTLIRYEWRDTLCELGVIDCRRGSDWNRLWDRSFRVEPDYAPYPPGVSRPWYWRR